jgi:hypothetical protein
VGPEIGSEILNLSTVSRRHSASCVGYRSAAAGPRYGSGIGRSRRRYQDSGQRRPQGSSSSSSKSPDDGPQQHAERLSCFGSARRRLDYNAVYSPRCTSAAHPIRACIGRNIFALPAANQARRKNLCVRQCTERESRPITRDTLLAAEPPFPGLQHYLKPKLADHAFRADFAIQRGDRLSPRIACLRPYG